MRTSLLICVSLIALMFVATGCYEVVYTVETKGTCIKFEDAMFWDENLEPEPGYVEDCLGEDGVVQADYFYVELDEEIVLPEPLEDGDTVAIEVTIKAGKCKETIAVLTYSDTDEAFVGEACGFMISGAPVETMAWGFEVESDDIEGGKDGTAALSNIAFCFGDIEVVEPEEDIFETVRAEEEDLYPPE